MNKFELYCMIYYALDAEWEENRNEILGNFLSIANPFLFSDIDSADASIYENFCKEVPDTITVENSYKLAKDYISSLKCKEIYSAFNAIDKKEWNECLQEYLLNLHKGKE